MPLKPISLNVRPGTWQQFTARRSNKGFLAVSSEIMERDYNTCQFCGFQAQDYQQIINLDGNYRNNKKSNLTTSCVFCTQCQFIESIGLDNYGGGSLIYLPEMPQAELNSLCHVLFCAIANNTGYKDSAQGLYRSYKFRSQLIEETFGSGNSEPANFGRYLLETEQVNDRAAEILKDVRLLPSRAKFKTEIEHWAKAAMEEASQ